jgi:sec-independent protein translocase protein TatA
MGLPSGPELLVILAIVVLLFGAKKIPDLAKGIGKGIKDFKNEMKDDEPTKVASDDVKKVEKTESTEAKTKPSETTKQA